jgi:hypothetical protein
MKKILFSLLVVMLSGCVTNATRSVDDFQSQVQVNYDGFKKTTWVETPSYYFRGEDNFSVMVALRSLYVQEKKEGIQIYIEKMGTKWGFYHSAIGEDGYKFNFRKINEQVNTAGRGVTVTEIFALDVPYDYLEKMASRDLKIKIYGKQREGVFTMPANLSKGFLDKMKCYENKQCT